jgi:CBS domain-containing protein
MNPTHSGGGVAISAGGKEGASMARLTEATRFASRWTDRWADMDAGTLASKAQDIASALARQAAKVRDTSLASETGESGALEGAAALLAKGLQSANTYVGEQSLRDTGRDALALIRRHPVQAILLGAGATYIASRRGRLRPRASSRASVKSVMTPNAEVIRPDAPLQEAAAKMADLDVGAIPVCDGERLVGMLTDRDITVRAVARGADPTTTKVRDAMTTALHYVFDDEPIQRAVETMQRRRIRRLPVLDRNKRLVGIVALADLAVDARLGDAGAVLHSVSEPARPQR